MHVKIIFVALFFFLISACEHEPRAKIAYLSSYKKEIPVWIAPGARNNPLNNGKPIKNIPAFKPVRVEILNEELFETGSIYYLVKINGVDENLRGYVARNYLFKDSNGVFYYNNDGDEISINSNYYSTSFNCKIYGNYFAKKEVPKLPRGEFETKSEYKHRVELVLQALDSYKHLGEQINYVIGRNRFITYDIDSGTANIPLSAHRDGDNSFVLFDVCELPLGKVFRNESGSLVTYNHLRIYPSNPRNLIASNTLYYSGKNFHFSQKMTVAEAKALKGKEIFSVFGLQNLFSPKYDVDRSCYESNRCSEVGEMTYKEVSIPYMFVFSPRARKVLSTYFSKDYMEKGITRDIQILLLKLGIEFGYPDGEAGDGYKKALRKAVDWSLIMESDIESGSEKIFVKLFVAHYCKEKEYLCNIVY